LLHHPVGARAPGVRHPGPATSCRGDIRGPRLRDAGRTPPQELPATGETAGGSGGHRRGSRRL
jgi:hypothetical protein